MFHNQLEIIHTVFDVIDLIQQFQCIVHSVPFILKYCNFRTIFAACRNNQKITWHDLIVVYSNISHTLIMNQSFLHFHIVISCLCAGTSYTFIFINIFTVFLKTFLPLVKACFVYSRLAKSII